MTRAFTLIAIAVLLPMGTAAQGSSGGTQPSPRDDARAAPESPERETAPVILDGRSLFDVVGVPALPAAERAGLVSKRIAALASDRTFDPAQLETTEAELGTSIRARGSNVVTITELDAAAQGSPRLVVAAVTAERIRAAIAQYRAERTPRSLWRAAGQAAAWTAGLILLSWLLRRMGRRLESAAERWFERRAKFLQAHGLPHASMERVHAPMVNLLRGARIVAHAAVLVAYLLIVLDLSPWTRAASRALLPLIVNPLARLGRGFVAEVPNLVFLVVLWFVMRLVLRMVRAVFAAVEAGTVRWSGFDPEWAAPTCRIVRVALVAFALVVAYPHIPGSETGVFKGISLFVGVLFSLGSSSIIANVIAGYSMTYRRAFRPGDRVQIGEVLGDVQEVKVLVTRLRTPKHEEVIIPNSTILTGNVVNYSALARTEGLIVHATVGIGYETPWRQVEAMLLEAAARTPGVERAPPPFVVYQGLGDFCVSYEINGTTRDASAMIETRTALQRNILDVFNEYGVQIMTPAYEGDPAQPKVVPRDQWYAAPARTPVQGEAGADATATRVAPGLPAPVGSSAAAAHQPSSSV